MIIWSGWPVRRNYVNKGIWTCVKFKIFSFFFKISVTKFWNFLIILTGLAIKDHKGGLNDYKWAKKEFFGDHKKSLIEHNLTNTDLFLVDRGYLDRGSTVVTKPCQQWLIHIYFHATNLISTTGLTHSGLSNF